MNSKSNEECQTKRFIFSDSGGKGQSAYLFTHYLHIIHKSDPQAPDDSG